SAGANAAAHARKAVRYGLRDVTNAPPLVLSLEAEFDSLRFAARDADVLIRSAEFLLPGLDHIVAGRQILDLESALVVGHREERMREDAAVSPHPLVHVALEAQRHLRLVELLERLHLLEGLADVELGVDLGQRVNVVERSVAVQDLERLARL